MSPEVLQPGRGPAPAKRPWEEKPKRARPPREGRGRSRTPIVVAGVLVLVLLGVGLALLLSQSSTTVVKPPTTPTTTPSSGGGGTTPGPGGLPTASETSPANVPAAAPPPVSTTPPAGAVTIGTGDNAERVVRAQPAGTSFVLASGVHDGFSVVPKTGDRFYGQPGAVLDGQGDTAVAFSSITHQGMADNVAVLGASLSQQLLIRNYNNHQQEQLGTIQTNAGSQANGTKQFAKGWDLQYVTITGSYSRGITLSDDMTVAYCRVVGNDRLGIGGGGQGITIVHDVIDNNGVGVANRGSEAGGIKTTGRGVLIADNQINNNGAPGVWTDVNAEAVRVLDNVITHNENGVHIEISHNVQVTGNRIANNKKKAVLISASSQVTITGNLIVNNQGGVVAGGVNRGHKSGPHPLTDVVVEGNVIINSRTSGVTQKLPPSDTVKFDYNTFSGGGFVWNGHHVTFNQWQAQGQETHGKFLG
ncbi:MAG TPA: right-handed parallel beta-helix repeat-containing protein [Acidimicrobiales bacterium]|nr:right-handed parallel beta-helix repeat-containing protein [Acidimicrobiales bacterium]